MRLVIYFMCRVGSEAEATQVPRETDKTSLTKSPDAARCVGARDTSVNQCRYAEIMVDYAYYKAKVLLKKDNYYKEGYLLNRYVFLYKISYNY